MTTVATVAPAANYARPLATGQRGGQLASASAPPAPLRPECCTLPSCWTSLRRAEDTEIRACPQCRSHPIVLRRLNCCPSTDLSLDVDCMQLQ